MLSIESAEGGVEAHHDDEPGGEGDCADVGVRLAGHFGDKLLNDDVDHGAGGEAQKVRQHRDYQKKRISKRYKRLRKYYKRIFVL